MTGDPYSGQVRALFGELVHAGELKKGVSARVDDQGVRIFLTASGDQSTITALRFLAWGCPHLLAAAEAVCRDYEGRSWDELADFRAVTLMQSLPVPREKMGRILVLEDAVRSLGQSGRDRPDPGRN